MPKIKRSAVIEFKGLYRCQRSSLMAIKKIKIICGVAGSAEHMPWIEKSQGRAFCDKRLHLGWLE